MKLAIIGSGPIALEAALRFHTHGASLTWYQGGDENYYPLFTRASNSGQEFVSDIGLGILQEMGKSYPRGPFSWQMWREHYQQPLMTYLSAQQKVRGEEVISVTKRFLGKDENIVGKSRFYDLFRVIFLVDPKKFIQEQKEVDPEKYQKLSQELVGSLQSTIEMFEDFDLVIDLRATTQSPSIAQSGRALGEGRMSAEKLIQGLSFLTQGAALTSDDEVREIAIIGSGAISAEVLLNLGEWLKDARNRLFLITHEEDPFAQFMGEAESEVSQLLHDLLHEVEVRLEKDFDQFHASLREWQELDDFVRVKKLRPAEPIPQVNFFSGHNATAIDELIDRRRIFLTLERPDFREGKKHPENNRVELKTIGVDRVINAQALRKKNITPELMLHEPGFFDLIPAQPSCKGAWEKDLKELKGIEDEIFKLFSPADHH